MYMSEQKKMVVKKWQVEHLSDLQYILIIHHSEYTVNFKPEEKSMVTCQKIKYNIVS